MRIFLKEPIYLPDLNGGDMLVIDRGIHEAILNGEYAKIPGTHLRVHKSIFDILPETMTNLPYDICLRLRAPDQPTSSIENNFSKKNCHMSKILPIPNELKILDNLRHRLTPAGWEAYRAETSLLHPGEFYWDEKSCNDKKYRNVT